MGRLLLLLLLLLFSSGRKRVNQHVNVLRRLGDRPRKEGAKVLLAKLMMMMMTVITLLLSTAVAIVVVAIAVHLRAARL